MFSRILFYSTLLLLVSIAGRSQNCDLVLEGYVLDEGSQEPLSYVNVFIQELSIGAVTDDAGHFYIYNLCPGEYHIIYRHIGCEPVLRLTEVRKDSSHQILLSHTPISLDAVSVLGQREAYNNQPRSSVSRQQIEDNAHQSLAELVKNESGVHLIKNGSGISKPVIQGMYGNRLVILNNGIIQSGQQWGNDHSPELDPLTADKITVIKGANALAYSNINMGGLLLVEPKRIAKDPHLHGSVNYSYDTNGRGHSLHTRIHKYGDRLAWALRGTTKKYGDRNTPDYFLNNTGSEEWNLSYQAEKSLNERTRLELYASTFNMRVGVLRGSQVGSVEDLEVAFTQEEPYYTEETFSYEIEAPKQHVSHHLLKLKGKTFLKENTSVQAVMAVQLNDRREFDIRRYGRSERPAMSLEQLSLHADVDLDHEWDSGWTLKSGIQNVFIKNRNIPETGILPLIPDYNSWRTGLYSTLSKPLSFGTVNLGLRFDFEDQQVAAITLSEPREVVYYSNQFYNPSAGMSLIWNIADNKSLSLHSGLSQRSPGINERYSNGLHQGVSGIEEGDVNLGTERSIKNSLEYQWTYSSEISLSALGFYQNIQDYIFLEPQDELRPTIRGVFPVFTYAQNDAAFYGLDLSGQYQIGQSIFGQLKYSYLRAKNTDRGEDFIFIPPTSVYANLAYRFSESISLSEKWNIEDVELEANNSYVFQKEGIREDQDFFEAPEAYNLLGLKLSGNVLLPKYQLRVFCSVDNLLDTRYRDYLNRLRYFSDEPGRSVVIGAKFSF